jgi:hypothetical protein
MKDKIDRTDHDNNDDPNEKQFPGYPLYPASEDIYSQSTPEDNVDPEDITKEKASDEQNEEGELNTKDYTDTVNGDDLDVPGSELDDDLEEIGSEDEENNYYSIGGDNHNDLEEREDYQL